MFALAKHNKSGGTELKNRAEVFTVEYGRVSVFAESTGGLCGGAEAADFILNATKAKFTQLLPSQEVLAQFMVELDREIALAGAYGEEACVIVAVSESHIFGATTGGTGAWIISETGIDNLTAAQHRMPFLSSGQVWPVVFSLGKLRHTLLVASDGLLKYAAKSQIVAAASCDDLNEAVRKLADLRRYQSGVLPDDLSVILVRPL